MRNGDVNSAVRILPNDVGAATTPGPEEPARPRRWFIPLGVVLGVVGVFGLATRPGDPAPTTTTSPPARIADVDAETIDLRTSSTAPVADEWVSAFDGTGQISDVIRAGSSFVAVGSTNAGAQVWLSGIGSTWRLLPRFDRPDTPKSSIDHAVSVDDRTVALGSVDDGIGVWTSIGASAWGYHGLVEPMGMNRIAHLVSGPEIMAVGALPDGGWVAWFSRSGVEWSDLVALTGLEDLLVFGFAADNDHFYAFGQHDCKAPNCAPEIVRSTDGRAWESVGKDLLPNLVEGMVTDLVATKDRLLAVGWGRHGGEVRTHVWESRGGIQWLPIPGASEQIRESSIEIAVTTTGLEPNPWATLTINGAALDAAIGSIIETDTGPVEVTDITLDSVVLIGSDGHKMGVPVGELMLLTIRPYPRHIAAEGPRMVITGYLTGTLGAVETAWLSVDGGTTWATQQFPEIHGDIGAATAGASIIVYGEAGESPLVWRNGWDTEAAGYLAEDLVGDYINALNGDIAGLISVLPRWDDGSAPPQLAIPSLSDFEPAWWDTTTGEVIPSQVQDTLAYLAATETDIQLDGCVSVVSLGAIDRIAVRCDYTADSALLSMFGLEDQPGKINAVVRNGRLSELHLDVAPSAALWRVLANYTDVSSHRDADLAAVHLAAAGESLSQVLHPGATRTVDTVLGTMEWTWLDSVELGDSNYIGSVTWSDLGFVAVAFDESGASPGPTIWQSADGREWTELPAPEDAEGVWELKPFAGGVLGQAWFNGTPRLVYFDGTSWSDLAIEPPDSTSHQEFSRVAVSGDQALVLTTWWHDRGGATHAGTMLNTDLMRTPIDLPEELSTYQEGVINVTGSDEGFLVAVGGYYGTRENLSVWTSSDGVDWELLTQTSSLEDAQYIWNLQEHRLQYFVVGETLEMRCSSQEETNCTNVVGMWSSTDGVEWDRVLTENGEPIAARAFGSGPLGLIAFGQEFIDTAYPRSVFMSQDGDTWTAAGGLTLLDTSAQWWWSSVPAVGKDTVIAAGSAYRGTAGIDTARPFLIIGRLVDG